MIFRPDVQPKLCFVLMPFGSPFNGYYKKVYKPAIENAGLESLRADEIYGTGPVINDVWKTIWRSRLIIADVTGKNPNVNYELGIAHTLGIATIITTRNIDDVPFDYRFRRCIVYNTNEAGWEDKLRNEIQKTIEQALTDDQDAPFLSWPYKPSALTDSSPLVPGGQVPAVDFARARVLLSQIGADEKILRPKDLKDIPSLLLAGVEDYFAHFDILEKITAPGQHSVTLCPCIGYPLIADRKFMPQHYELLNWIEDIEETAFANHWNLKDLERFDMNVSDVDKFDRRLPTRARFIIGLSFFFCPAVRQRDFWSAIPLGYQRAIGLVCHESLFKKSGMPTFINRLRPKPEGRQDEELKRQLWLHARGLGCEENTIFGIDWDARSTCQVMCRLINSLKSYRESRMYVLRGFVMGDILVEFLRSQKQEEYIPYVARMISVEDVKEEAQLPIFPKYVYDEPQVMDAHILDKAVALFDLGYLGSILRGARGGEYKIIFIKHGLDVPVGLGFSLPTLPFLFRKLEDGQYWWQRTAKECARIYGKQQGTVSARDMFLQIGIELDQKLFP